MPQGDNLLSVLNTLESRAVVLEAELEQIDADIALNATMARKYGKDTLADGSARLEHMRVCGACQLPSRAVAAGSAGTLRKPYVAKPPSGLPSSACLSFLLRRWRRAFAYRRSGLNCRTRATACARESSSWAPCRMTSPTRCGTCNSAPATRRHVAAY